jgi:sigma-B regulation protein RsbU (phosphoserine phosphatase)
MAETTALIVAEPSRVTADLDSALRSDGFQVRFATPGEITAQAEPAGQPDLVLITAALGLQEVALLSRRLAAGDWAPAVVVFPEGEMAALESCVRGGFDFVTPPFLPSLLRSRMSSCWQRGQLSAMVEEMAAATRLSEYERELSIAHEIQSGFLPSAVPTPPGWEIATRFRPAKPVSGDFYDVFTLIEGRRLGLVVADVCDKGVAAALFMALIRTLVRYTAQHTDEYVLIGDQSAAAPAGLDATPAPAPAPAISLGAAPLLNAVVGTNRYLARNHLRQGYFATLFFGVLDPLTGRLLYINAGHNPPMLTRAWGEPTLLAPTGPAVGMLADSDYTLGHAVLEPGDMLFVYTDGVIDARNGAGAAFGTDRVLASVLGADPRMTAEQRITAVEERVHGHVGLTEQFDDITMLVLRRQSEPSIAAGPPGPAAAGR